MRTAWKGPYENEGQEGIGRPTGMRAHARRDGSRFIRAGGRPRFVNRSERAGKRWKRDENDRANRRTYDCEPRYRISPSHP